MRDTSLVEALEREHQDIDGCLVRFAEGLTRGDFELDTLQGASAALRRHIYLEEELLFPALRAVGLTASLMVMVRDHGEIWQALDQVDRLGIQGTDCDAASQSYSELVELLREHNRKEELVVYPAADRLLADGDNAALRAFFPLGVLPEGWICTQLRRRGGDTPHPEAGQ